MTLLDEVYVLVKNDHGIWYSPPAPTPIECWNNAWKWEMLLFEEVDTYIDYAIFQRKMQKDGWRAKKVAVSLLTN